MTYPKHPQKAAQIASPPRKRLLRLKDAAVYLSLSPWKLRRLVWEQRLPVVQDGEGSPFLFDQFDLDSYVETHKRTVPL